MTATSHSVIARLQSAISAALDPYQDGKPFALLDFPDHPNVGDSSIWLGEIAYFARTKRIPAYVAGQAPLDWRLLNRLAPDGPIYLHGGGNFGDLWPRFHAFRLAVLARFPGRRVIQLPQSIHFSNPANIAATQAAISRHGAFSLLVRDRKSYQLAKTAFDCEVALCPDMAFCLGPQRRPAAPTHATLHLRRTDLEQCAHPSPFPPNPDDPATKTMDWLDEPAGLRAALHRRAVMARLAAGPLRQDGKLMFDYFLRLALRRHHRGLRILAQGHHVVTDRLHAHILCTLLDIPHTALDNSYGKISNFITTWSTNWSGVTLPFETV